MKLRKDSSSKYLANIVRNRIGIRIVLSRECPLDKIPDWWPIEQCFFPRLARVWNELDLAQLYSFEYSGKSAPLADTVRRTSCWRWMIDLRRIILHGYLGYAAPRNIIDVNSRKATARGHKENVETRYRVASTRFSGFPPVNLPRRGVSRHGYARHGWSWCKMFKKKQRKNLRRCLLYPVNVCFFAILFQTSFIAGIEISIFQKPRIEKMVKFWSRFGKKFGDWISRSSPVIPKNHKLVQNEQKLKTFLERTISCSTRDIIQ